MNDRMKLALIYGSTREGRFCDTVARWAAEEIEKSGEWTLDLIDPLRLELPARHERVDSPAVAELGRRIADADAVIIVTPEYNHGYPAALKFVIDSVYSGWKAKPVAFISYGGISGGLRAVEQLRQVFAELHAVTVRETVSFSNVRAKFDAGGSLVHRDGPTQAMAALLANLRWWAIPLRDVRRRLAADNGVEERTGTVLINVVTPKPGRLQEFLDIQVAEQRRLAGQVPGLRGNRLHRSSDGRSAVGIAVFDSVEDHQRWWPQKLLPII
jgi:NAD(P)H-dependent FMN reductase